MSKKITKKQALEQCIKLWTIIKKLKEDYKNERWMTIKRLAEEKLNKHYYLLCPCCEYKLQHHYTCEKCPLINLWHYTNDVPCCNFNSVYYKIGHHIGDFEKNCKKIIDGATKELIKVLTGENNES